MTVSAHRTFKTLTGGASTAAGPSTAAAVAAIGAGPSYRGDIDGLRAVAVLGVLGFHAFPNLVRGGFVGVDVFFVISGYLITQLLREDPRSGPTYLARFYARRIRRIFPALLVVLASTFAVGWYVLLSGEFRQLGKHAAAASVFASNFVLWSEAGYFDASADSKPLLHLWSLAIEEQFYLLYPLIILVARRAPRQLPTMLAVLAAVSFGCNLAWVGRAPATAFYAPWCRTWELLVGGLLALGHRASGMDARPMRFLASALRPPVRASWTAMTGLGLIALTMVALDQTRAFPGWWAILPVTGTVLVIAAGPRALPNRAMLGTRPLVWIGLISYPLYLWHWPVLRLYLIAFGDPVNAGQRLLLLGAAFVLAWLTWRWVELPIRRRPADWRLSAVLGLPMLAIGALGAAAMLGAMAPRNTAPGLEKIVSATTDWRFPPPSFHTLLYRGNRFFEQRTSRRETTVFIGDSNLEQFAPRIADVLAREPRRARSVVYATRGGCLPIPGWTSPGIDCGTRLRDALAYAARAEVDTIVLAASWINLEGRGDARTLLAPLGDLMAELTRTRRVFLVLNIPAGKPYDPRHMFSGSRMSQVAPVAAAPGLDRAAFLAAHAPLRDALLRLAETSGVRVIDPFESLCPGKTCATVAPDGRPLYIDEHHMRPFHARESAAFLDRVLFDDDSHALGPLR